MDLWKPKDKPVTVEDEVPITQWEAERKKEVSQSVHLLGLAEMGL